MYLRRLILLALACGLSLPASAQITLTRGADLSVDASADGRVAIDLLGDLWVVPGNGGDAQQLTQNLKTVQRPRWSPDAQRIVYQASVGGQKGLWIYEFATGAATSIQHSDGDSYLDLHPAWHPDGERIVYSSDRAGYGLDLWEVDLPSGLRWKLSDRPGDEVEPAWSSDGRDLVYILHQDNRSSLVLRRHGLPDEDLVTSSDKLAAPTWRPDGSLITYFRTSAVRTTLEMVILSQPRLLRTYATNEPFVAVPVSWLDKQQMVYSANGEIRQRMFNSWRSRPINFRALLQPERRDPIHRERAELTWIGAPTGKLVIHAFRLFDGVNSGYRHDKDIVISSGRVSAVEDHAERPGTIVIDMGDLTVIPGFIDANARLPSEFGATHGPDLLTLGITTVVGRHVETARLNVLWSGKDVPGPRLLDADDWPIGELSRPELDVTAAVATSYATGQTTGVALATQFRAMALAGLTPEQTLRAVGVNAAAAMMADPYLGRISTGAAADLVFVAGDPLSDIDTALNVVAVVRNGRFYSVSGLIDRAKAAETVE